MTASLPSITETRNEDQMTDLTKPAKGAERARRSAIGYTVTYVWCRDCAPEGVRDYHEPMREGDDWGVAYRCDTCDAELKPCEHKWGEWFDAYGGGQMRGCDECGGSERSDG